MKPFPLIVLGLAIVVLDFRLRGVDAVFDPVGWLLVALGARDLSLRTAAWAASVAAVLSVADAVLPYRYVQLDPVTGERIDLGGRELADSAKILVYDPASGLRLAVMASATVAAGVALWLLLTGLLRKAQRESADRGARHLRLLRWIVPGMWAVPYLVVVADAVATDGSFDPVWNDELEYVVFLGLLSVAWLVWLLMIENGKAWTFPTSWEDRSPVPLPARTARPRRLRGFRLAARPPSPESSNGQRQDDTAAR